MNLSAKRLSTGTAALLLVAVLAAMMAVLGAGRASAATCPTGTYPPSPTCVPTQVLGETVSQAVPTQVLGESVNSGSLPFTGAAVLPTLGIGVALVVGGVLLTSAGARRRRTDS